MLKRFMIAAGLLAALGIGAVLGQQGSALTGTNTQHQNEGFRVGMLQVARQSAITAFAGGGQASATQLVFGLNRVSTVASAADSVKLPVCDTAGKVVIVINAAAANAMNVYGQTGETINALSANTALSVAANKVIVFVCGSTGAWYSLLTA